MAARLLRALAARHARSQVVVSLAESSTDVTLRVVDDGPGIPDADRERAVVQLRRRAIPRHKTADLLHRIARPRSPAP